jgi:hypothetical protein
MSLLFVAMAVPAFARERVCGTITPSADVRQQVMQRITNGHGKYVSGATSGTISVAFHVITDGTTGAVTQEQIDAQIEELNTDYAISGLNFTVLSVDRTDNATWFHLNDYATDAAMKASLAIDPAHVLNIYSLAAFEATGVLGYAYYPFTFPETDTHHGLVIHYNSMPGGEFYGYNWGRTAVHELGHYFGLYHTFENGCTAPGDEIDDTPYEAIPAVGCPYERDTCPQDGLDPVYNFMDYADDPCMSEFTPMQAARMSAMLAAYRPSLLLGGATATHPMSWGHLKAAYR